MVLNKSFLIFLFFELFVLFCHLILEIRILFDSELLVIFGRRKVIPTVIFCTILQKRVLRITVSQGMFNFQRGIGKLLLYNPWELFSLGNWALIFIRVNILYSLRCCITRKFLDSASFSINFWKFKNRVTRTLILDLTHV